VRDVTVFGALIAHLVAGAAGAHALWGVYHFVWTTLAEMALPELGALIVSHCEGACLVTTVQC
jgi:succinate dehydrogenase/fumarate reductase cytochrome b subunit